MFNPFTEVIDETDDLALIESARGGSLESLEKLVLHHQAWVYNIAVRMVFHPQDAEEVTQEVLIKAVTRLSTFQGQSAFRTWLYRIAANHVLNMNRRGGELRPQTFASYAAAINDTPDLDLPDPKSVPVDVPLLVEEAKLTCTTGMLMCLDRQQRLVFTLGEILGVGDTLGGELLEMSADNFRQHLLCARRDLYQFMNGQCGLVNVRNPCRCPKKTKGFIAAGHVDPGRLLFVPLHARRMTEAAADAVRQIDDALDREYAAVFREHPFLEPSDQAEWVRRVLDQSGIRTALRLDWSISSGPLSQSAASRVYGVRRSNHLELTGEAAQVTGASKGIGAGIARELAAAGAAVVVNYATDRAGAESVVGEITSAGGRAVAIPGDVSRSADVARLLAETGRAFGRLDVLVNNAGVYTPMPLEAVTEGEFHREFDTNVLGPLLAIRESLKHFGPGGGSVINIGSGASRMCPPGYSIYAASKAAPDAITGVLARELAPRKIRVNSVNPGATLSDGTKAAGLYGTGSDFEKRLVAMTTLGRVGTPEDIARVVAFPGSDDAGWLTGEVILASGGLR